MRVLDRNKRPIVEFDASNVEHRLLFQKFRQTRTWAHSPVQFDLDETYRDLPYYISTLLVEYYTINDKKMVDNVGK